VKKVVKVFFSCHKREEPSQNILENTNLKPEHYCEIRNTKATERQHRYHRNRDKECQPKE